MGENTWVSLRVISYNYNPLVTPVTGDEVHFCWLPGPISDSFLLRALARSAGRAAFSACTWMDGWMGTPQSHGGLGWNVFLLISDDFVKVQNLSCQGCIWGDLVSFSGNGWIVGPKMKLWIKFIVSIFCHLLSDPNSKYLRTFHIANHFGMTKKTFWVVSEWMNMLKTPAIWCLMMFARNLE